MTIQEQIIEEFKSGFISISDLIDEMIVYENTLHYALVYLEMVLGIDWTYDELLNEYKGGCNV